MDEFAADKADAGDLELGEVYTHESVGFDSKDVGEVGSTMRVLMRVDLDLTYSSEKLKISVFGHTTEVFIVMEVKLHDSNGGCWGTFLEVENFTEVLMGTSKELVGRLQLVQFSLNDSMQREDEAKRNLLDCMELERKETALKKTESRIAELITDNSEVCTLREKVKLLEKQHEESDSKLKNANASNEEKEEQHREMENIIESMKENVYIDASRAESARGQDNTSRAAEQLYAAIWDMETLIEDLKSKVSKAEVKTENAEEQCIVLSEANLELNKEVTFLRTEIERLETSLEQAGDAKVASAQDINVKTNVIMDIVVQLAMERERIEKQVLPLQSSGYVWIVICGGVYEGKGNYISLFSCHFPW
ncbi:WPP domain-interacting protein 2 [Actinidia rufa]|uniref:WPP domain-interacting protein 2 n=1 Tax=Actinidia rufa TaxID=165716 RepID=A0A7J0H5P4_9ERIC|nr:WPP domain-interacting protein 2 [Actinidia rufa]